MTQDEAFDLLKLGENVFLTGAAGAGKSWLLNRYIDYLRAHDVGVAVTASTGVAATHLNGRTLHSWSGIGVRDSLTGAELEKLAGNRRVRRNYTGAKVLIIDEISMLHPHQLDMVDRIARAVLDGARPFGGLQVVLSGDFFQLPPVSGGAAVSRERFAWNADAWETGGFRVCYLHEQHRQGDDPLLVILNDIRAGRAGEQSKVPLRTRYKREPAGRVRPTRLYARNINVDSVNDRELARLDGELRTFAMETRGPQALVDGLKKSCLAPESLRLKEGAQVMFVRNANDGAYVNGTRGIVTGFDEDGLPLIRTFDGDILTAAPMEWTVEENGIIRAAIIQVPLRLAWAMTIHKSQGMTLDTAEIDLSDAFEPGMGYVALSRVRSLDGLKLMGLNDTALRVDAAVSEQDDLFKEQSARAREYLRAFAAGEKRQRQEETLLRRFEGKSQEQARQARKARARGKEKRPTQEITLELLNAKTPLQEIARQRRLKPGTILQHMEKLKGQNALPDIDYLREEFPPDEFDRIVELFREAGDGRLAPVRAKLGGRYSYEALRIVRLFAW